MNTLPKDLADHCELVIGETNTPEWEAARQTGIGCSDLSAILGLNPWRDRHDVWLSKTQGYREPDNWRMAVGHALEPIVRDIFTEREQIGVDLSGMLRSKHHPWLQYSPDGLTADGGLFEAKTTTWWSSHEWADDSVADHAEIQVQGGMAVTGRSHAWVAAMIDGNPDNVEIRRVERDDDLIADMLSIGERFWFDYVMPEVEPPLSAASLDWVKAKYEHPDNAVEVELDDPGYQAYKELRAAQAEIKKWEAQKNDAEARLRSSVQEAGVILRDGQKLGTFKEVTTHPLSQQLMRDAGLNPADYKGESSYTRFYWPRGK